MFNKNKITLETRENKLEKIKKKGFKKAFFTTVMSMGVLLGCTGMLVGCGEAGPKGDTGAQGPQGEQGIQGIQGVPGVAGSMWFTGTAVTGTGTEIEATVENTKVGDIYFNTTTCDLYQCVDENTWSWLSNLKGDDGQPGEPGQPGGTGATGAAWLTGTAVTGTGGEINATVANARVGDLYFNTETCDIYQCTAENTWNWISNIKGDKGEDGTSVYVGYDGYIWNGTTRTELSFTTLEEDVAENTLELKDNKYFANSTISAGTKVALMTNYFKYIDCTQYSGTVITELSTYVSANGKLDIGVVNISTGTYTLKETKDVEAGLNTIALNIEVAQGETLVIGGANTTVDLYKSSGVEANDKFGEFTTDLTNFTLDKTNQINDKLIVNVKIQVKQKAVICTTPELESVYASRTSNYTAVMNSAAPFIYTDANKFAGQTLKKMKTFVNTVSYDSNNVATMDIALITVPDTFDVGTITPSYDETYTIKLPKEFFESATTINKWIEIDFTQYAYKSDGSLATEGIVVGENQTLVFAANEAETIMWGFNNGKHSANDGEQFYQTDASKAFKSNTATTTLNFLFYVDGYIDGGSIADRIENLEALDKEAYFEETIKGKQLSILGDSISTFTGVSNDSAEGQGDNAVWYTTQLTQNDTYWQQIINEYEMNLCVNNSWSGAFVTQHRPNVNADKDSDGSVSSGMARADELDSVDGDTPDYIIVYIGINDLNAGVNADTVATAYNTMLDTITTTYPNAKVFCVNMPNRNTGNSPVAYNTVIQNAVNSYNNTYLVDLYNSEYSGATYQSNSADNLHPNAAGMDYMTDIIVEAMKEAIILNYER